MQGLEDYADNGDPVHAALQRGVAGGRRHAQLTDGLGVLGILRLPARQLRGTEPLVQGRALQDPELVDAESEHCAHADVHAASMLHRLAVHEGAAAHEYAAALLVEKVAAVVLVVEELGEPGPAVRARPGLDDRVDPRDVADAWRIQDEVELGVQEGLAPANHGVGTKPVHAVGLQAPELEGDRLPVVWPDLIGRSVVGRRHSFPCVNSPRPPPPGGAGGAHGAVLQPQHALGAAGARAAGPRGLLLRAEPPVRIRGGAPDVDADADLAGDILTLPDRDRPGEAPAVERAARQHRSAEQEPLGSSVDAAEDTEVEVVARFVVVNLMQLIPLRVPALQADLRAHLRVALPSNLADTVGVHVAVVLAWQALGTQEGHERAQLLRGGYRHRQDLHLDLERRWPLARRAVEGHLPAEAVWMELVVGQQGVA
mmetsp:Transcript_107021/g.333586  ORF Transcript_107021/g.333586 Transcript_107021/m.333586 type:complete len:427 (-) Transcript_107021:330-1610(-)